MYESVIFKLPVNKSETLLPLVHKKMKTTQGEQIFAEFN